MSSMLQAIGELVGKCETWNPISSGQGDFEYIDLSSVDKDAKVIAATEVVPCSDAPSRARQLVKEGDVLVSTVRPNLNGVAKVERVHGGTTASTGFCVLRPSPDKLDTNYLFQWVRSAAFIQNMIDVASGANYPAVSDKKVKESLIPLPPLEEQKRIAKILDAADALRARRRESLAQLDALPQSTFLDLFGDPVENPRGWDELPLEEIVLDSKIGLVRSSKEFGWDFTVPYVRMDAVSKDGKFLADKVQFTEASQKEIQANSLLPGDFLFNTRNSKELVGKSCIYSGPEGWLFNNNLMRIRFIDSVCPEVIATQFNFSLVSKELEQRKSGTTNVFAVYWKNLKSLPVLVPPKELQVRYADMVRSVNRQSVQINRHLEELDKLFFSLQQRAFSGEL
jgi:type I restriction enzyme S subunit